mmetsp:Transcript_4583/g.6954  ORF Transcript_4583/g.6954 Transcript_4583/m.6954 type:complete len:348 (-) Transcript_4583:32-1075(-)
MIGDELRYRYVEEQSGSFLDDLYNITQIYIQTSWNDTSILSSQAMLLGLYPPTKNNYVLEESQKYTAIPPVEGFDFTPWIEEMGLEALPHQTTVFPIQMNGWSYDYFLALDNVNCPKRGAARAAVADNVNTTAYTNAEKSAPNMTTYFDKYSWEPFCNYLTWADAESVELQDDIQTNLPAFLQVCADTSAFQAKEFVNLENGDLEGLSSNEVRKHLNNTIYFWMNELPEDHPHMKAELSQDKKFKVNWQGTAGTENPKYFMFWTNENLLTDFANAFAQDQNLDLTASSSIIFEFTLEGNDLMVEMFVDDVSTGLKNCGGSSKCKAMDFAGSLGSTVHFSDMASACKA